jgi:hypothetical protein
MDLFSDVDNIHEWITKYIINSCKCPKENANQQWEGPEPGAWEQKK